MAKIYKEIRIDLARSITTPILSKASVNQFKNATYQEDSPFIQKHLKEYRQIEKSGLASEATKATLYRAFPDEYSKYASLDPIAINGAGSVAVVDAEGQMITANALSKAFKEFMNLGYAYRNLNFNHSNQQVGVCLPIYKSVNGFYLTSGVKGDTLHVVSDLNTKLRFSGAVLDMIQKGILGEYSIGGRILEDGVSTKIDKHGSRYQVIDNLEIFEVTVCGKGVNPLSQFDLVKGKTNEDAHVRDFLRKLYFGMMFN